MHYIYIYVYLYTYIYIERESAIRVTRQKMKLRFVIVLLGFHSSIFWGWSRLIGFDIPQLLHLVQEAKGAVLKTVPWKALPAPMVLK